MTYLASILIGITAFFGGIFHHSSQYDGSNPSNEVHFGTTGYPSALDTTTNLPNPASTDSVATVSHSALHTNENLAIIASETKLGTGASTPVNNSIFTGTGSGLSGWSTSATSSNFSATNFLTASSTMGSTSIITLLARNSTTTNFSSSNLASTTNFRANSEIVGDSNIGNLTVTSCSGCSTGASTIYSATTTNNLLFKTLNLVAGDVVNFQYWTNQSSNACGSMSYRISSPWSVGTTTVADNNSCVSVPSGGAGYMFLATTTETVTFASNGNSSLWMRIELQHTTFNLQF